MKKDFSKMWLGAEVKAPAPISTPEPTLEESFEYAQNMIRTLEPHTDKWKAWNIAAAMIQGQIANRKAEAAAAVVPVRKDAVEIHKQMWCHPYIDKRTSTSNDFDISACESLLQALTDNPTTRADIVIEKWNRAHEDDTYPIPKDYVKNLPARNDGGLII